jgi:uncharacterized protein YdhG (YjbR/CyaY superfamily)
MQKAATVDDYIAAAPEDLQDALTGLRAAIKSVAPKSVEKISYGMPFYEYKGRLVYFGLAKAHIGLYIPPPVIADHQNELTGYGTTKSAVHLPLDKKLPLALIKKMVKARMKLNDEGKGRFPS